MSNIEELINKAEALRSQIHELQKPINDQVFALNQQLAEVEEKITKEAYEVSKDQFGDYGTGTAKFETPNFKIKTAIDKKVKWDEQELRNIANQIRTTGQDPEAYITYKLSVTETAFKKFPENIQAAFVNARTVETGKPKTTWERK